MTPGRILVSFVVLGVILGGFGIYEKLIDYAGAGATTPIIGFGNVLAKGAISAVKEHGLIGALFGGAEAAAAGCNAAFVRCRLFWFCFRILTGALWYHILL